MQKVFTQLFWKLLPVLILMGPAFYNGFPLVYSDTGTYIKSGMELTVPMDRPVMYGLFIQVTSLFGASLWLVVFCQSIILSYVLRQVFQLVTTTTSNQIYLVLVAFLSATTGVSWYASQIMPDIFSAVTILCIPLLLCYQRFSRWQNVLVGLIAVIALNVHFSNVLIAVLCLLGFFILGWLRPLSQKLRKQIRFSFLLILLAGAVGTASIVNYVVGGTFKINQGSHMYLMGRMIDNGVLQSFLDDRCETQTYALCAYKDSLPASNVELLWGGTMIGSWEASEAPFYEVFRGMITSPRHVLMFGYTSLTASLSQLFQNDIGSGLISNWYQEPGSPPYTQIAQHFPHELNPYMQSRQNTNLWGQGLNFNFVNAINSWLMLLCSLLWLTIVTSKTLIRPIPKLLKMGGTLLLVGIVANAIVVASLANIYDRLQARVSWLLVFVIALWFLEQRSWLWAQFQERYIRSHKSTHD